jgi:methionyl-tRNA synthetase
VVAKKCDGVGPAPRHDSPLAEVVAAAFADADAAWESVAPSIALDATWRIVRETNAYLEANEPWKADPGPEVDAVLGDALEVLRVVAILASPAIPSTSEAIWQRIGLSGSPLDQRVPAAATWGGYPGGLPVEKGAGLFPRIQQTD